MKRTLLAASAAAVLVLTGCGGDGGDGAGEPTTAAGQGATSGADGAATNGPATDGATDDGSTGVMARNEAVRRACEEAVGERLAGAEFPSRSTLRAASAEGGRLYTVNGSAQVDGSVHTYSCSLTLAGEDMTVDEVLVDGQ